MQNKTPSLYRRWTLSQNQEITGHIVPKKPVIKKIKVVEKEARQTYRKGNESTQVKRRVTCLKWTDRHDLPDLYLPLLQKKAWGVRQD